MMLDEGLHAGDPRYRLAPVQDALLREDYKAKKGNAYSLKDFHDAFIKLGPLALPLVRKAMLGDVGTLFYARQGPTGWS